MAVDLRAKALECLKVILRPVVSYCLDRQLTLQEVVEALKIIFIEQAVDRLEQDGKKINASRLSVITGVHRKDIARIHVRGETRESPEGFITGRVIGQWQQDQRFLTKNRKPRVLTLKGQDSEFCELVQSVSTDVRPGAVLFDLERLGFIERVRGGVKLKTRVYLPVGNPEEGLEMLVDDCQDLMYGVMDNVFATEPYNFHLKTVYDNIDERDLPKIRDWLFRQGSAFHQRCRNYISKFDLDMNPPPKRSKKTGGHRIAVGSFTRS